MTFAYFPVERVVSNLSEYGNTSAASIPLALDGAVRDGSIKKGDVVRIDLMKIESETQPASDQATEMFYIVPLSLLAADCNGWIRSWTHVGFCHCQVGMTLL